MITPIPFVPTPRLEYTMRYNEIREDYRLYLLEQQRYQLELERKLLQKYQDEKRIEENREMKKMVEELNLYTHLDKVNAYRDYKYAYWVGTTVDQYI